jgi:hypothetical protein
VNIPLGQWSGSDATDRLRETMIELDKTAKRQTRWLIGLTWALVALTAVIAILTVVLVLEAT